MTHNNHKFNSILHSIRFQITILLFLVFGFGGLLIFYTYQVTIDTVYDQASSSHADMMRLFTTQIDDKLDSVRTYFESTMASNDDLVLLENASTDTEYMLTKIRLINSLQSGINMFPYADFIYVNETGRNDFFRVCQTTNISESTKNLTTSLIALQKEHIQNKHLAYDWHLVNLGGNYYFVKAFTSNTLEVGICINLSNFLPKLADLDLNSKCNFLFINPEAEILLQISETPMASSDLKVPDMTRASVSAQSQQSIIISYPSATGVFCSEVIIPRSVILAKLPWFLKFGRYLVLMALLFLPVITLVILQKYIYHPLKYTVQAMKTVASGDMKIRINESSSSSEFELVNRSFNNMLDQITLLKLNAYKEEIYRQKAELNHLKLQLNPHFLLNSLNMVYTLVRTKHLDIAQEFTMCLIKHFRYILRKDKTFVTLNDELGFIKNYLRLHQLHYPDSLTYTLNIPDYLKNKFIPQLMIENFIENTIKYATPKEDFILHISIDIAMEMQEEEPFLNCIITDNGNGFSEELLELFNSPDYKRIPAKRVGVYNTRRRLDLIYKGDAKIKFSNIEPHGARIEFLIPLDEKYNQISDLEE